MVDPRRLLTHGLRLIPQWPRTKRPITIPGTSSIWPVDDSEDYAAVLKVCAAPNWALHLDESGLTVVDIDSDDGLERALAHGVTKKARVWVSRTRKGWHLYYSRAPGLQGRFTGDQSPIEGLDLLAKGLVTLPPSIHPSGHRYEWVKGHSPTDIPPAGLELPPEAITQAWLAAIQEREEKRALARPVGIPSAPTMELVIEALGGRHAAQGYDPELRFRCPWPENHQNGDRNKSFGLNTISGAWLCRSGCASGQSIRSLIWKLAHRSNTKGWTEEVTV
ncbi:MAG: bifunctional DNA primase/polymerase [Chloroflexi bacterium]|nr:bifunctional DNA primase/polymerase [Chloroflexota bacterium]